MADIKANPTLQEVQEYISEHWRERGFDNNAVEECLLLAEEVGELAKAIRKESGMGIDSNSQVGKIPHELVDILWATVSIANLYNIDLEQAFRDKEAINHARTWTK